MYSYRRIMVGLDFSELDETLIAYAAFLSYYLKPEKIYFINVQDDLDVPDEVRARFEEFDTPRDEMLIKEMKEAVATHFPDHSNYSVAYNVIEGSPRREILHWTHVKNVDLLLVGRKAESGGSGLVAQQLSRKVSSSVLFVPKAAKMAIREMLVAVDFSDCSQMALEEAIELCKQDPEDSRILCQYIYTIPYGYAKTGKSEEEFARIMLEHAKERYEEFMKPIMLGPVKIEPVFTYDQDRRSTARLINQEAHRRKADLIIIGARGRTAVTALFLGSVAEKLTQMDTDIPLLVVKRKGKNMGILDLIEAL